MIKNLFLSVGLLFSSVYGSIDHSDYTLTINNVLNLYSLYAKTYGPGFELIILDTWGDDSNGFFSKKQDHKAFAALPGGLARVPSMTKDSFDALMCYAMGLHFGAWPLKSYAGSYSYDSIYGQAFYHASLKCLRKLWKNDPNVIADVFPEVKQNCALNFPDLKSQNLCERISMASYSVAMSIYHIRKSRGTKELEPNFSTPSKKQVRNTSQDLPDTQCILDTLFQGALCPVDEQQPGSLNEPNGGSCTKKLGHVNGLRPTCWFRE